jgi:predicted DNA-binding protein YlxM (UPF0122 family)
MEEARATGSSCGFFFTDDAYLGSKVLHRWRCKIGHEFSAQLNSIQQGHGCRECWKARIALPRPNVKKPASKRSYSAGEIQQMADLFRQDHSFNEIATITGFDRSSIVYHVNRTVPRDEVPRRVGHKRKYEGLTSQQVRRQNLLRSYDITLEQYDKMVEDQTGVCAICKLPPAPNGTSSNKLNVDHDHTTGSVRALLCVNCNVGLGKFKDTPELLEAAAVYLRTHGRESQKCLTR